MFNSRLLLLVLLGFYIISLPVQSADQKTGNWDGLRSMMGVEAFQAAGLDKLSPEEMQKLDQWLLQFLAHDSQQVIHADENIKELQKVPVQRRIAGHFSGWKGKTVFTLDNGEVWRQRLSGRYAVSLESPEVEIYRNFVGYYELRILETGRKIGVTRVK